MPVTNKKQPKHSKLRHLEYYDLQGVYDGLYEQSKNGLVFNSLLALISSEENIKLAYRNIKRNKGSVTCGVDNLNIRDIEKIPENKFVDIVKKKLQWYQPKAVRRVEIPKPNGKKRPLGIPAMWDRIVQQCILQVLEPICEAKFHERSNGFRPNRSAEHAIAQSYVMIQVNNLHFVVDIDIKGFFDNVNHAKLIRQMWEMGIRDKKLLCIIKAMLKAPVVLEDGTITNPEKGTPQGGILSPLLSNIVLNELDWWIASQWECMPAHNTKNYINRNGSLNRGNAYQGFRKGKLKEMYIVRYADDFKVFCRKRSDADKIFVAVKQWLWERLKLEISNEKSKVVNLKKSYSEFLGFKIKAVEKRKSYVVKSHMCDKAIMLATTKLKEQVKKIATPANAIDEAVMINYFNSMVVGMHQYYQIATDVRIDFDEIAFVVNTAIKNRLGNRVSKKGNMTGYKFLQEKYGRSKQLRFIGSKPLIPIAFVQHKNPMWKKRSICKYTVEGRAEIHKKLGINMAILHELMRSKNIARSIEYMDNRISLYAAQYGKCAIIGTELSYEEIHCHHRKPISLGGDDRYCNLIIVHKSVHQLIHATQIDTIQKFLSLFTLNPSQMKKLNKLRKEAMLPKIA